MTVPYIDLTGGWGWGVLPTRHSVLHEILYENKKVLELCAHSSGVVCSCGSGGDLCGVSCVPRGRGARAEGGARAFCTRISFSPPGAGLHTPPCTPRAQRQPPGHMPLALRMRALQFERCWKVKNVNDALALMVVKINWARVPSARASPLRVCSKKGAKPSATLDHR